MWSFITSLLTKWALLKLLLKTFGSLGWLIPVAFILKFIGLPVLAVLALLALPVFIILAIVGLPIMFVVVAGILLLVGFFALLSIGVAVLKIAIPILLVYWLLRWWFRNGKKSSIDPTVD
ncbi:MAG TPA: hypothetical protein VIK50_00175 [Gemmatimonadaceae bacterium]